jgi:uncharacterized membrane protein
MNIFPPLPATDGLHPLIVHFPIALLLTAPIFIVLSGAWHSRRREMIVSALILVALGTLFTVAATWSGEEGEHVAKGVAGAKSVLHDHEELGELTRNLFLGMTGVLAAAAVLVLRCGDRLSKRTGMVISAALLILYIAPALVLVNAAHQGGRLVHELGVRAWASAPEAATAPPAALKDHDD